MQNKQSDLMDIFGSNDNGASWTDQTLNASNDTRNLNSEDQCLSTADSVSPVEHFNQLSAMLFQLERWAADLA